MPLSWNEIKTRAAAFVHDWQGAARERAEAQSFWNAFLHVFGVHRRRVASFEANVEKVGGRTGFIDLLWPGVLAAEHKSRGKDLTNALFAGKPPKPRKPRPPARATAPNPLFICSPPSDAYIGVCLKTLRGHPRSTSSLRSGRCLDVAAATDEGGHARGVCLGRRTIAHTPCCEAPRLALARPADFSDRT